MTNSQPPATERAQRRDLAMIRFKRDADGMVRDRRWFWTPLTYRFGHGGWVFLSLRWLWRFRHGA